MSFCLGWPEYYSPENGERLRIRRLNGRGDMLVLTRDEMFVLDAHRGGALRKKFIFRLHDDESQNPSRKRLQFSGLYCQGSHGQLLLGLAHGAGAMEISMDASVDSADTHRGSPVVAQHAVHRRRLVSTGMLSDGKRNIWLVLGEHISRHEWGKNLGERREWVALSTVPGWPTDEALGQRIVAYSWRAPIFSVVYSSGLLALFHAPNLDSVASLRCVGVLNLCSFGFVVNKPANSSDPTPNGVPVNSSVGVEQALLFPSTSAPLSSRNGPLSASDSASAMWVEDAATAAAAGHGHVVLELHPVRNLIAVGLQGRGSLALCDIDAFGTVHFRSEISLSRWGLDFSTTGDVSDCSWSPDGACIAVGWRQRGVSVWSADGTCRMMCTIPILEGCTHSLTRLSGDGLDRCADGTSLNTHYEPLHRGVRSLQWGLGGFYLYVVSNEMERHSHESHLQGTSSAKAESVVGGTHQSDDNSSGLDSILDNEEASTPKPLNSLVQFRFVKHAVGLHGSLHFSRYLVLLGSDRLLLLERNCVQQESPPWEHILIPANYLSSNWPIRSIACNRDGSSFVVAGSHGAAVYHTERRRWSIFGNLNDERMIMPTCVGWFKNRVVLAHPYKPHPIHTQPVTRPMSSVSTAAEFEVGAVAVDPWNPFLVPRAVESLDSTASSVLTAAATLNSKSAPAGTPRSGRGAWTQQLSFFRRKHLARNFALATVDLPGSSPAVYLDSSKNYLCALTLDNTAFLYRVDDDSGPSASLSVVLEHMVTFNVLPRSLVLFEPVYSKSGQSWFDRAVAAAATNAKETESEEPNISLPAASEETTSVDAHARGGESKEPSIFCIIHNYRNELILSRLDTGRQILLSDNVNQFWLGPSATRELTTCPGLASLENPSNPIASNDLEVAQASHLLDISNSLWIYGKAGMKVWFPLSGSTNLKRPMPVVRRSSSAEFDLETYPLAVVFELGAVVGITQGLVPAERAGGLPLYYLTAKNQPFLHAMFGHMLRSGSRKAVTLQLAHSLRAIPHFAHSLELLLHETLNYFEMEDTQDEHKRPQARISGLGMQITTAKSAHSSSSSDLRRLSLTEHDSVSDATGNHGSSVALESETNLPDQLSSGLTPLHLSASSVELRKQIGSADSIDPAQQKFLKIVIEFLQDFPELYCDVVVRCARKSDMIVWPGLFAAAGSPEQFFERAFENHNLAAAASYLRIILAMSGEPQARICSMRLLERATDREFIELDLMRDLIRFITQLDEIRGRSSNAAEVAILDAILSRYAVVHLIATGKFLDLLHFGAAVNRPIRPWLAAAYHSRRANPSNLAASLWNLHSQFYIPFPDSSPKSTPRNSIDRPDIPSIDPLELSLHQTLMKQSADASRLDLEFLYNELRGSGILAWALLVATVLMDEARVVDILDDIDKNIYLAPPTLQEDYFMMLAGSGALHYRELSKRVSHLRSPK